MKTKILFILIFVFVAVCLFAAEDISKKFESWDHMYWASECSIEKEHRISVLCGFFSKSTIYTAESTMMKCKEEVERLKEEHGMDFELGKRTDDYYRTYAADNRFIVYDWKTLAENSEEEVQGFIERTEKDKSGLQHFLDKEIEKSKIGGVINKKRAYDLAKQIIVYEDQISNVKFYYLFAKAKLEEESK